MDVDVVEDSERPIPRLGTHRLDDRNSAECGQAGAGERLSLEPIGDKDNSVVSGSMRCWAAVELGPLDGLPRLRRAAPSLLEPEHEVVTALGGADALTILERDRDFDVVFCDLLMPRVDGVAVYSALERSAPQLAERVVFCSGGAVTRRSKEFLALVQNRILEKPLAYDVLLEVIKDHGSARQGGRGSKVRHPRAV